MKLYGSKFGAWDEENKTSVGPWGRIRCSSAAKRRKRRINKKLARHNAKNEISAQID
jgi:hypothetical protein